MQVVFYINPSQVAVAVKVFGEGDNVDRGGTLKILDKDFKESVNKLNAFISSKDTESEDVAPALGILNKIIDLAAERKIDLLAKETLKDEVKTEKVVFNEKIAANSKNIVDK